MLQLHWGRRLSHDRSHANPSKKDEGCGRLRSLHLSYTLSLPRKKNSQVALTLAHPQAPGGRGRGEEPFPLPGLGDKCCPRPQDNLPPRL